MKNLVKVCVGVVVLISSIYAENMGKKQEGYRIEVVVDTVQKKPYVRTQPKEIRFLLGDKIINKFSIEGCLAWEALGGEFIISPLPNSPVKWTEIIISPTFGYLIKCEDQPNVWKKDEIGTWRKISEARLRISYINARGEVKWSKDMEISYGMNESDEDEPIPYFVRISKDGSKIVLVRNYKYSYEFGYQSDIIVYDTLGNEVISVLKTYGIESRNQVKISPDGKLIGAEVWHPEGRHLLFIDVETGRIKIVKAEGENWKAWYSLSTQIWTPQGYTNLPSRHIKIWWKVNNNMNSKGTIISFDELPEDLSVLFKQGDEK